MEPAVPEAYVVFCDSRSTTFRPLSLTPWRTLGASEANTATRGQRLPSASCPGMVLTASMTSAGEREEAETQNLPAALKYQAEERCDPLCYICI